jgi:hypothetical protein
MKKLLANTSDRSTTLGSFYSVNKTIPRFPQAGFHANNQLVVHLQLHGYLQTSTPSLFLTYVLQELKLQ